MKSVDFNWYLDVHHGADYFRRWHRLRKNSGSLLVHKASHHFDLVDGRLPFPHAWATGRIRLDASFRDLLRLRSLMG